ncbi:MAG: DUF2628 domain-containing protein [Phycisphaerales bacterium]|nr:DUF2628 domain-containing protein [Phycisphaerales bacterium]
MNSPPQECERYASVKPKWRTRFAFFDAFGAPNSVEARAALEAVADSGKRSLITRNWTGYLLGPIYFLALGMWRRALTLSGIIFLAGILPMVIDVVFFNAPLDLVHRGMMLVPMLFGILGYPCLLLVVLWLSPHSIDFLLSIVSPNTLLLLIIVAVGIGSSTTKETVNYSLYLSQVKGDNGWNPWKGNPVLWEWAFIMPVLLLTHWFLGR